MSYPQPNSNEYAVGGYQFFRLNTLLSSPGDIYESEQSGHAFAIGPESDVANVRMAYFDDEVATFLNQTKISSRRTWVGRLDARNEARYAPANRPGRLFFWCADLYDPLFLPDGFTPNQDNLVIVTPRLDVIEYFKPLASLVPPRNDKNFTFQELPLPAGSSFVIIPYWDRKYASCRITNLTSGNVTYNVFGVNYYMNDNNKGLETAISSTTVATNTQHETIVRATVNGMFDALMLQVSGGVGPTPIQVIVSDEE